MHSTPYPVVPSFPHSPVFSRGDLEQQIKISFQTYTFSSKEQLQKEKLNTVVTNLPISNNPQAKPSKPTNSLLTN
jgi:hypothetical protein